MLFGMTYTLKILVCGYCWNSGLNWDFCSAVLSPGSKRSEALAEQRDSIVLTQKNVQVFGLAQCLWHTRFTLTEHLLLLFSCLLNKLVMLSDHLSICMVYFTCYCNAGLKDSLQCCSSVTQCFGAFMGFGMLVAFTICQK